MTDSMQKVLDLYSLLSAAATGDSDALKKGLQSGASSDVHNFAKRTALHFAVEQSKQPCFQTPLGEVRYRRYPARRQRL